MRTLTNSLGLATDFDTLSVGGNPAVTLEQRLTRCYELAGYAIALGTAPRDSVLIHGTMHAILPGTERIGHAWLEISDTLVWEPISRQIWHSDAWSVFARTVVDKRYTRAEARYNITQYRHWGPWIGPVTTVEEDVDVA